jgi:Domain of unknown function (DUF4440)
VKIPAYLATLLFLPHMAAHAKPTDAQTKQALVEIERKIGEANLTCDYKYFAEIEAPEFIFTGADGSVTTRAQDLAGEATCKPSTSTYDVDETAVWLNGATAVVTAESQSLDPHPQQSLSPAAVSPTSSSIVTTAGN